MVKVTFKLATLRNQTGSQPIKCTIRVNGTEFSFHTGLHVSHKKYWKAKNKNYTVINDSFATSEMLRTKSELTTYISVFTIQNQAPTAKQLHEAWEGRLKSIPTTNTTPQASSKLV